MRYGSDREPGVRRVGRQRFRYVDATGVSVGPDELARIRALAIPPAWTDVWIAPEADWHLQATGRDARGRKQYLYSDEFRAEREAAKFEDLRAFGLRLAALRRAVDAELSGDRLTQDRIVAVIVRLLDTTLLRVGNEQYARTNNSYGLTTLRSSHVSVDRGTVRLRFRGKAAHDFDLTVDDPGVARVVRRLQHLPGQMLFQYVDDEGQQRAVCSTDVNDFLQRLCDQSATAKTFRTWGASVMGAALLAEASKPTNRRERNRVVNDAIRVVAGRLGNTLAVCRSSYVHPAVYEAFDSGDLAKRGTGPSPATPRQLSADERRFWGLIATAP